MNAGVCQWVFNKLLVAQEMDMFDCIHFVGTETEADCFEPLSRYWKQNMDENLQAGEARGISGHSMGGHGALVIALKHPGRYRSVSAFAPIVAPSHVPWGEKAFDAYLGPDSEAWKAWDATELVKSATEKLPILIDQGRADEFLDGQLKPWLLEDAAQAAGHPLVLRMQPGHDHSYYFIASFIGEHIAHHAAALKR